jgi:hypothetical protein
MPKVGKMIVGFRNKAKGVGCGNKGKVEQATKAQRGSRGIALLFLHPWC